MDVVTVGEGLGSYVYLAALVEIVEGLAFEGLEGEAEAVTEVVEGADGEGDGVGHAHCGVFLGVCSGEEIAEFEFLCHSL